MAKERGARSWADGKGTGTCTKSCTSRASFELATHKTNACALRTFKYPNLNVHGKCASWEGGFPPPREMLLWIVSCGQLLSLDSDIFYALAISNLLHDRCSRVVRGICSLYCNELCCFIKIKWKKKTFDIAGSDLSLCLRCSPGSMTIAQSQSISKGSW